MQQKPGRAGKKPLALQFLKAPPKPNPSSQSLRLSYQSPLRDLNQVCVSFGSRLGSSGSSVRNPSLAEPGFIIR